MEEPIHTVPPFVADIQDPLGGRSVTYRLDFRLTPDCFCAKLDLVQCPRYPFILCSSWNTNGAGSDSYSVQKQTISCPSGCLSE